VERTLVILIILTSIIHLVDTLAYSVRLNSVKSGQVALSFSLFNLIALVSRTANTFLAPLIAGIIALSIKLGLDPIMDMRKVILAATFGTLAGVILIPSFLRIFEKAVNRLEVTGSVPSLVVEALQINNIKRIVKNVTKPSKTMLEKLRYREIPKRLIILNILVTGIYTIGVLSASYAATLVSGEDRLEVIASSGMINGIAALLLTLLIDPKAAMITDQALRGKRPYGDVKALVVLLISSKVVGTLLGQVLFLPAARVIAYFYS